MASATISSKFQLVIPKEVREQMGLEVGTEMEVLALGNRIELVPLGPMSGLRGFLPGIDTSIERDDDR